MSSCPKIEEWVEHSHGKIRADVAHDKLVAMGFTGSERTTRRAVAEVKAAYRAGHRRVHRPWVPEPGLWLQYDYGDGPRDRRRATVLFCAWLAWSPVPGGAPVAGQDDADGDRRDRRDAPRCLGGVPTYVLTDNEKTVTIEHVAGIAVRNPQMVDVRRPLRADDRHLCAGRPGQQGRRRRTTVKIAKADLVPTRRQPAAGVRQLRRARGGVRGVLRAGERAGRTG